MIFIADQSEASNVLAGLILEQALTGLLFRYLLPVSLDHGFGFFYDFFS
jgi:hypothetical protein